MLFHKKHAATHQLHNEEITFRDHLRIAGTILGWFTLLVLFSVFLFWLAL